MGAFDFLQSINPMAQGASIIRTLIIAVIVFIIFMIIWITWISSMKGEPGVIDQAQSAFNRRTNYVRNLFA